MSMELIKKLRNATGAGISACQKALKEANDNYEEAIDILRKQGIAKADSKADRETGEGLCCISVKDGKVAVVKLNCETDFVAKNQKFQLLLEKLTDLALTTNSHSVEDLTNQNVDGVSVNEMIKENIATIGENIVLSSVNFYQLKDGERADYYVHNKVDGKDNIGMIVSVIMSTGCESEEAKLLLKQINMHITAMFPFALTEDRIDKDVLARERAIYEEQVSQLNKPADISAKMIEGKIRRFYEEKVLLKQMFVLDNKKSVANVISDFNKANGCDLKLIDFLRISVK